MSYPSFAISYTENNFVIMMQHILICPVSRLRNGTSKKAFNIKFIFPVISNIN